MIDINPQDFKCRASCASILLGDSKENPTITEKQTETLAMLDAKDVLTDKQKEERTRLVQLKDNSSKVVLSATTIAYLMEWYAWATTGKKSVSKEAMYIKYVEKGKDVEEDSIKLLSFVDGLEYKKNEIRISNDFLTGIPDIYNGEEIMQATKIDDVKSAWDYPGYLKKINTPVSKANDTQIKVYMDITGAMEGEVADCLVNTPVRLIKDFHDALLRKMDVISELSPEFVKEYEIMERSMIFDDIPQYRRVFKKPVQPFTDFDRQKLYDKVKICREWLFSFDQMYKKLNN